MIIDVRNRKEYLMGCLPDSVNIPLNELYSNIEKIRRYTDITLVCTSGMRSAQAKNILHGFGIECKDGGSWVNFIKN